MKNAHFRQGISLSSVGGAIGLSVLVLLAGCGGRRSATPAPSQNSSPYLIGAGDTLELLVWHEAELSGPVPVRPDGMISIALIGDVQAAGLTPEALAARIHSDLSHFVDSPNVVVRVASTGSRRFFIIGNVRSPGTYDLRADQTLLQALAVAGGLTEFARPGSLRIIRSGGQAASIEPDYDAIVRGEAPDIAIQPNDTIVVP